MYSDFGECMGLTFKLASGFFCEYSSVVPTVLESCRNLFVEEIVKPQLLSTTVEVRPTKLTIGLAAAAAAYSALAIGRKLKRAKPPRYENKPPNYFKESSYPGSPMMDAPNIPPGQVKLAIIGKDGVIRLIGSGIRVGEYLLTPTHNLMDGQDIHMIGGAKDAVHVKLDMEHVIDIAPDVSAIMFTEATWSQLGIARARLGCVSGKTTAQCVSSVDMRMSIGTLNVEADGCLGRLVYQGSTIAGYSGSAYTTGNKVLGMHTHGKEVGGGGYEIMYLYMKLKLATRQWDERDDNYDYTDAQYATMQYEDGGEGLGKAIVRETSGKYQLVKSELISRIEQCRRDYVRGSWADESELYDYEQRLARGEYREECALPHYSGNVPSFSGEGQSPAHGAECGEVAPRPLRVSGVSRPSPVQQLTREALYHAACNTLSKRELRAALSYKEAGSRPSMSTAQPTRAKKRSGAPSASN